MRRLEQLEQDRMGEVILDGGSRFYVSVEVLTKGDIQLKFQTESDETSPGKLRLEGYFHVNGEYASSTLGSLIKLFKDGSKFIV